MTEPALTGGFGGAKMLLINRSPRTELLEGDDPRPFRRFSHSADELTYRAHDGRGGSRAIAAVYIVIININ
jgi:hypothetical protein